MMQAEGRGRMPPKPVAIELTTSDFRVIAEESKRLAKHRAYSGGGGTWKPGIVQRPLVIPGFGEVEQAERAVFIGQLGEYAVARCIRAGSVDFELKDGGDDGVDLRVGEWRLQIKTRQKPKTFSLIRRTTETGRRVPIKSHLYAFVEWLPESAPDVAHVLGWVYRKDVLSQPHEDGIGNWTNFMVHDRELRTPASLRRVLRGKPRRGD